MVPITKSELQSLMVYISSFFLLHQKRFEYGYIYGTKFHVIRFDSEAGNLVIMGLSKDDRFEFIKDFGKYALKQLLKSYEPDGGYFIFKAENSLFMTTVFRDHLKVKRIKEEDLKEEK